MHDITSPMMELDIGEQQREIARRYADTRRASSRLPGRRLRRTIGRSMIRAGMGIASARTNGV